MHNENQKTKAKIGTEMGVEKKEENEFEVKYQNPDSHKNFWKTFGLNNNAGKLLFQLYGKSNKIKSSIPNFKKKAKIVQEMEEEKERERKEYFMKRKPNIQYPTLPKPEEKEKKPEKVSQRKPLAKILEETNNYEEYNQIPTKIGRSREEEKKILVEKFSQEECKMMPANCVQLTLTEEEKKEVLQNSKNRSLKYSGFETKEEKMLEFINKYEEELKKAD